MQDSRELCSGCLLLWPTNRMWIVPSAASMFVALGGGWVVVGTFICFDFIHEIVSQLLSRDKIFFLLLFFVVGTTLVKLV